MFYDEHLHADEEVVLITAGSGYYEVRDKNDDWLRVEVTKGDFVSVPAGMYHRFAPDKKVIRCLSHRPSPTMHRGASWDGGSL